MLFLKKNSATHIKLTLSPAVI